MEITINIKGLEGFTAVLEKLAIGQISIPQYMPENQKSPEIQQAQIQQSAPEYVQAPIQQSPPIQAPIQQSTQQGVVPQQPIPQQTTYAQQTNQAPTTLQSYSMEQLAVAATQLVDAGQRDQLVNLLSSFGAQSLTTLPKEQYGAFATALRGLGAKL